MIEIIFLPADILLTPSVLDVTPIHTFSKILVASRTISSKSVFDPTQVVTRSCLRLWLESEPLPPPGEDRSPEAII